MAGREQACVELAAETLDLLGSTDGDVMRFPPTRATLAIALGTLFDLPWPVPSTTAPARGTETPSSVQSADLCTRFWLRIRDARLALLAGSVPLAERILTTPSETAPLHERQPPDHVRVVELFDRALLAELSSDQPVLKLVEEELAALGAPGEASLVAGFRAEFRGDRRGAADAFGAAAATARFSQPPTRAMALACQAQVLDAAGQREEAMQALAGAASSTEVRRNILPFLGWSRQGTPMHALLTRLDSRSPGAWVHELALAHAEKADVTAIYAPSTPTPRERDAAPDTVVTPDLSPREREVLAELARGSTYADIAAELVVSENTVKTHVSSLYGKLGASRRSEALAVARSVHLL
jgi:DNA-binding CsgD family transcriptional regulator